MSNQPRSRTTSRTPASRPRRIAGQGGAVTPGAPAGPHSASPEEPPGPPGPPGPAGPPGEPAADSGVDLTKAAEPASGSVSESVPEPEQGAAEGEDRAGLFAGTRVTAALLVAIVVLTVATLGMAGYLWLSDDGTADAERPPEGEIAVPEDRPIQIPMAQAQEAASAAAEAATTAFSRSWQDYDAQVDEAARAMTSGYAEEFRTTTDDAKSGVVDQKLEIQSRVVAQSVVRANTAQVQALLFLDQYTTKPGTGEGSEPGTTVSSYRLLVTLVHTDGGWLVSDIETR